MPRFQRITQLEVLVRVDGEGSYALGAFGVEASVDSAMTSDQGGFVEASLDFAVDDWVVSDWETLDDMETMFAWFRATEVLLAARDATYGEPGPDGARDEPGPWFESRMVWKRRGDMLELEDTSQRFPVQRLRISWDDYLLLMGAHADTLITWVRAFRDGVRQRRPRDPARADLILGSLPTDTSLARLDRVARAAR